MNLDADFEWCLGQDQAILAEVIKRSQEMGNDLGRTALQKISYFLKRRGVPLEYSFDLYHYGPFCQEILWDADILISMGVIVDRGGYKGGSKYEKGNNFEVKISEHREFIHEQTEKIDDVVRLLSGLDASTLEVAATIDYFYRYVSASGAAEPRKAAVLERFYEAKPKYISNNGVVEKLYEDMAQIDMVGP